MRSPKLSVLAALLTLPILTTCETGFQEISKPDWSDNDDFVMLPAWQMESEKKIPGKADAFSDFRLQYPEWYAATEPPKGKTFRSFLEWETTQSLLLAYPSAGMGDSVSTSIAMIAVHTAPHADVHIVSKNGGAQQKILELIKTGGLSQNLIDTKIHFLEFEADSIWMIDFGPFPLLDDQGVLAFADMRYYHNRVWDDALPARIAHEWGITDYRGQMDFEGGNFIADGNGLCYATQGVLWQNANDADGVKQTMKDYLGCDELVIIQPLAGEGTTHIDMFFKMASPTSGVLGKYTAAQDATNQKLLDDNADILAAVEPPGGGKMHVTRIPMPPNNDTGGKVWRTYTNSTFVKPVNIWPVYTQYQDLEAEARAVWEASMPAWEHIGVLSDVIITWGGAQHCVSRNIPAGTFGKWIEDGSCNQGSCLAPENGFTGDCKSDDDCYGPEWLCECNDCASGCVAAPDKCGGITYDGCCAQDGNLKYCENNAITSVDCGSFEQCGWDPDNGWYDCGFSAEGPEDFPKNCPGEGPCGDVPEEGVCQGDVLKWCEADQIKETDCAADGKQCGADGDQKPACVCPAACTEGVAQCLDNPAGRAVCKAGDNGCLQMVEDPCAAGFLCQDGQCIEEPKPDLGKPDFGIPDLGTPDSGPGADVPADASSGDTSGTGGSKCSMGRTASPSWPILLTLPLAALVLRRRRIAFGGNR